MLIADTHVHVYPAYDAAAALEAAYHNLQSLHATSDDLHTGLILTERQGDCFFRDVKAGRNIPAGFQCEPTTEPGALSLAHDQKKIRLIIFAGRQIVTTDGIEILCLASDAEIPDRLSTSDTLNRIRNAGGIPALSWAPGKWLFRRGGVIRSIIDSRKNESLLLGDTCMRPAGWPEPSLMKKGRQQGIPVVAGTDPLPFSGEENGIGTYGIVSESFDPARPVTSIRKLLAAGSFTLAGKRNPVFLAMRRWQKNQAARTS